MKRAIICAAVAAAAIGFAAPTQAATFDHGLNKVQPAKVQLARWHHRRHHSRHHRHPRWWNFYAYSPRARHYTCWNDRVRVGYHWRWVRRCGWRRW
jgi:hypothetical protein